ncbi:Hypothetical predicted protein [Paramuricea clavata]|uniref:Uncharacterized protein n=1 Tax=Paramuricea clavata TaxID=317549 RepID=A0A6S7FNT8_PARCT|nr:Hypothetical predicted protein [Paramuricea clavata]
MARIQKEKDRNSEGDDDLLSRLKNNTHEENKANMTRENNDTTNTFLDNYCEIEAKLEMVLSRLSKLEEKSQSEKRAQSLLVAENSKMVAKITCLTATVTELQEENESIRTLLAWQ